jgi:hypothetical protein
MGEVGRDTLLTDELFRKIKQGILDGLTLRDIAKQSELNESTLYNWSSENYLNLADKIEGWKRDRKLLLADITSDTIQTLPVVDENGKLDKELLKIKQKEAEFIRETLGKQHYSKRTELGGLNGKELPTPILYVSNDNSHNQDNEDEEENKSDSRGDISIKDNIDSPLLDTLIPERPEENSN